MCFPRPEDLKARSEKRLRETGKDVPVDAVNEMLGILLGGDFVSSETDFCNLYNQMIS